MVSCKNEKLLILANEKKMACPLIATVTWPPVDRILVRTTAVDWKPSSQCEDATAGVMATCTRRKLRTAAAMVGN